MSALKIGRESTITTAASLRRLLQFAECNGYSCAIWRLPHAKTIHLIIDTRGFQVLKEIEVEVLTKGFICCPYGEGDRLFIRGDIHLSTADMEIELSPGIDSKVSSMLDAWDDTEQRKRPEAPSITSFDKDGFQQMVAEAVTDIREGHFQKVVPSRIKEVKLPADFDAVNNFVRLTEAYPRAFVFHTYIPEVGEWMGATPETLIEIENGNLFRTVSLAGTQKYHAGTDTSDIAWTQKDIEEQAMVSRYIINCFKKIRLREFTEHGPKTVIAGNLIHLKTTFEVDMQETGFFNLGSVMLNLLHPTSAVCGMPKDAAATFISSHEPHERKFYSGFLGPVNNSQDTHVFVNLRCMEIFRGCAHLHAGAGVTEDSNPAKEWVETELKCNTLLNVIDTES